MKFNGYKSLIPALLLLAGSQVANAGAPAESAKQLMNCVKLYNSINVNFSDNPEMKAMMLRSQEEPCSRALDSAERLYSKDLAKRDELKNQLDIAKQKYDDVMSDSSITDNNERFKKSKPFLLQQLAIEKNLSRFSPEMSQVSSAIQQLRALLNR